MKILCSSQSSIAAAQQYTDKGAARVKKYYDSAVHQILDELDRLCRELQYSTENLTRNLGSDPYEWLIYDEDTGEPLGTPKDEVDALHDNYNEIQFMVKKINKVSSDIRDIIDDWNG